MSIEQDFEDIAERMAILATAYGVSFCKATYDEAADLYAFEIIPHDQVIVKTEPAA
jgi:hypothetical protein